MNQRESLTRLISILEFFQKRPLLYIGENKPEIAEHFLVGFSRAAYAIFNLQIPSVLAIQEIILNNRGWQLTPRGVLKQMKKKKMTAEEMILELTTIEIDFWRFYKREKL